MIDFKKQRENMVESQVRTNDVTDRRIIRAMLEVAREHFVPPPFKSIAYMDDELPYGSGAHGRAMLRPMVLAKLLQLASIGPDDVVLEVGTGTGYGAALLGRLAASVVSLECDEALAERATNNLSAIEADSVAVVTGPLERGYPKQGPYDVILFNGCVPAVPECFAMQLKPGGRLVVIEGEQHSAQAMLYERFGDRLSGTPMFSATGPALPGFEKPPVFAL